MSLVSAIILLFLVMDPVGNVPLFVSVLAKIDHQRHMRVLIRELLIALFVLLVFLLVGRFILGALQISEPSLTIAGGVILFLIALRMIFPTPEGVFGESPEGEPLVVPLAVPLVAGPSTIATALLLVTREPHHLGRWVLALVIAWMMASAILMLSGQLSRWLGRRVLFALDRLMGLVLTIIAVQMFLNGLGAFLGR